MSTQLASLIVAYAKTLPAWQKALAKLAFDSSRPSSEPEPEIGVGLARLKVDNQLRSAEESEIADILSEAAPGDAEITYIDSLIASEETSSNAVPRLSEIRDCQHVNALYEGQKITFAPKLTVIYGENGSGKSGYSRVLNSAFYSRGDKSILPNVLKPKQEQGAPTAVIEFEVDGKREIRHFPRDLGKPEFRHFACFDSKTVLVHLEDSNELYVLPKEMAFFERLANLVNIIGKKLAEEIRVKQKTNPFIGMFDGMSPIKDLISTLSADTKLQDLEAFLGDSDPLKIQLAEAERLLFQHKSVDPKTKVAEIKGLQTELTEFQELLESSQKLLSVQARVDAVRGALKEFNEAKLASSHSGVESFKTELFKTVGSESWKTFISGMSVVCEHEGKARGSTFPAAGDYCPLCHQKLDTAALSLFERYFGYLKGEAEKRLNAAQKRISDIQAFYSKATVPELSSRPKFREWLETNRPGDKTKIESTIRALHDLKIAFLQSVESLDESKLPSVTEFDNASLFSAAIIDLTNLLKSFNDDDYKKRLIVLETAATLLKHRTKLVETIGDLRRFLLDLAWLKKAGSVVTTISTRSITERQKAIFEEYFTKQYRQLFFKEASHLKVDFQIDVKPKGTAGKTFRKLEILNHSPEEVLSEGEQHAIALADFLTEAAICDLKGGLIFDDPVNSLDHERKGYIAKRLVSESQRRQLIVFTHDISFLFDLINEAERQGLKEKTDLFCHWVQRIEDKVGLVSLGHRKELELDYKSTVRAEELWKQARSEGDPAKREDLSKQGFDCLRKTYEAFILTELFAGTVTRFDRRLKYDTLKRIYCPREVAVYVSDRLGYCSGFVSAHLQADGYSGETASPELLKGEIDSFITFKKKFHDDRKTAIGV